MKSIIGFVASILAIVLLTLLGLRLYGRENRFPVGRYLATTDISLKEYRAAVLRRWGGDPKEEHYAAVDFPFVGMHWLSQASGLYSYRLYPPKDESDMDERCYQWKKSHVDFDKVDENTIRLTVSGESAEEAENSLKQIMEIYIDLFVQMEEELPKAFRGLPTWSGKAEVSKR